MKLKPASPGLIVLDPASRRPLPAAGAEVAESGYWFRRLRCGDVIPVVPEPDEVVQVDSPIPDSSTQES